MSSKKRVSTGPAGQETELEKGLDEANDRQEKEQNASGAGHDDGPGKKAPCSVEDLKQDLEKTRRQAQENYDRLLRVSAEFDNFKKRTNRQIEDIRKFANESLLKELLSVVDNLERAIEAARDNTADKALLEGIDMTLSGVQKILERFKVQPVEALGQPFDPNYHQAMMQEESDTHPPNTVIKELQKGYLIHDRLLRPALVVVSKTGSQQGASAGGKDSKKIN